MGTKEFFRQLGTKGTDRLRTRIVTQKGEITDLMIQYEARIKDEWHPIVRYDTAHGFPHRDVLYPNGKIDKYALDFPNLEMVLQFAEQDLQDRWQWYKEKYRKRLRR